MLDESHVVAHPRRACGCSRSSSRYAWPSELDLMARIAGRFRLAERWAGWEGEEFTSTSKAARLRLLRFTGRDRATGIPGRGTGCSAAW